MIPLQKLKKRFNSGLSPVWRLPAIQDWGWLNHFMAWKKSAVSAFAAFSCSLGMRPENPFGPPV
jgi:hypothetical protein